MVTSCFRKLKEIAYQVEAVIKDLCISIVETGNTSIVESVPITNTVDMD
jgi:hypothetical protein